MKRISLVVLVALLLAGGCAITSFAGVKTIKPNVTYNFCTQMLSTCKMQ